MSFYGRHSIERRRQIALEIEFIDNHHGIVVVVVVLVYTILSSIGIYAIIWNISIFVYYQD